MAGGEILITWVSESSAAIRDMNRVNRALGDSASKSDKWARRIDTAGTVAMGVFAGLAASAWKVTLAASDQEQAVGSLNAVFKKYSAEMENAADQAYLLGLSTTDYSQMAAVLGAQLKNLGLSTGEAADQTQELVTLGADLAAQFGGTTKDAVDALGSALRGERDPIERYGISLSEASIKAKMAETGLSKVEATLALLNEQAKKSGALGAAARESETLAAGLQQTQAAFQDLNAAMGAALGGGKKGGALGDLARALKGVSDWIEAHPQTFQRIAGGIAAVTASLIALKGALAVTGALKTLLSVLTSPFALAAGWVTFGAWLERLDASKGGVYTVLNWLKKLADFMANPVGTAFQIAFDRIFATIRAGIGLLERAARAIGIIRGGDSGGTGSLGLGGSTGVTRSGAAAPALLSSSSVGRLAPEPAGTAVSVYVDGVRTRTRTATAPLYTPVFAAGVI